MGEPMEVARDADEAALEQARRTLEARLGALERRAMEMLKRPS
jgi:hypothetical protein